MYIRRRYLFLGLAALLCVGAIGRMRQPRGERQALITDPEMASFTYVDGYITMIRR